MLDIECSLNKVYTFPLIKAYIPPKQIIEPSRVLCWAAKWLGEKKVHFRNENDKDHIQKVWDLLDEADAIIHYNGKAFDVKHLNREFLLNDMPPPSPWQDIDLLTVVRQNFKFASNKLEWVSVAMGYEGKVEHRGVQLWIDCQEHNDPKAWREMKRYNVRDVTEMEPIYHDLRPWIKNHPNWGHYVDGEIVCRNCGSTHVKKDGWERKTLVPYQRYRCLDCHKPLRGRLTSEYDENGKRLPKPSTV
ncbi:MAG: ribonuclease H-like domain-containing protein [Planctomycetota bacterium]